MPRTRDASQTRSAADLVTSITFDFNYFRQSDELRGCDFGLKPMKDKSTVTIRTSLPPSSTKGSVTLPTMPLSRPRSRSTDDRMRPPGHAVGLVRIVPVGRGGKGHEDLNRPLA